MILFVNGNIDGVLCTNIGFWTSDYESAFELLTQLIATNWLIQEAIVVDGQDRLRVPLEAFDGQPIQVHIRALQRQWQLILSSQPLLPDRLTDRQLKKWYSQLETFYDDMLTYLEKMILMLEMGNLLLATHFDEDLKCHVDRQYTSMLDTTRQIFRQTIVSREKNRIRINQFENER